MGSSIAPQQVADHLLLVELLQPFVDPEAAQTMAWSLLAHFGSVGGVCSASRERLEQILGEEGGRVADLILVVRRILVSTMKRRFEDRPTLGSHSRLVSYLKVLLAHETTEHLRVLYLDVRCRLIVDDLAGVGTINHAPAYPREIVRRGLDVGAKNIVLVHNHPSGDPTPSAGDIASTRRVAASAAVFEIELLDHYIVGRSGVTSMKQLGVLSFGPLYVDYEPRGCGKAVVRKKSLGGGPVTRRPPKGQLSAAIDGPPR